MQVVILAGGLGTRLQEETVLRPKPMVEIGGYPILWHIMKHYHRHQCSEFHIALGYKGDDIKRYFLDRYNLGGNQNIDFARGLVTREDTEHERWTVNLVDTGPSTLTGGRLLRLREHLPNSTFLLTYGDGVSDVDVTALLEFHRRQGRVATVTAVRPPARFGGLVIRHGMVDRFTEKPSAGEGWINGGFLALEPEIFDYLDGDHCSLEASALERVASQGQLAAYQHHGFWQCMDTLRDKTLLEDLWQSGQAPWKTWQSSTATKLQRRPDCRAAA